MPSDTYTVLGQTFADYDTAARHAAKAARAALIVAPWPLVSSVPVTCNGVVIATADANSRGCIVQSA